MDQAKQRIAARDRIRERVRRKIRGTADRPRLAVFKSHKHFYVQVIDDRSGRTLASASSSDKDLGQKFHSSNAAAAKAVGALIADRLKSAGLNSVVFDRSGYRYHGNIKALADAAREHGLDF